MYHCIIVSLYRCSNFPIATEVQKIRSEGDKKRMIGQNEIRDQLKRLIPKIAHGVNRAILITGPAGMGKTELMNLVSAQIWRVSNLPVYTAIGYIPKVPDDSAIIEIDEAHIIKEGFERLYPYIDGGKYVFLLATNLPGDLPYALYSRCWHFQLRDYTQDEARQIVRSVVNLPDTHIDYIIECGAGNPRIMISLAERVKMMNMVTSNFYRWKSEFDKVFGYVDGIDTQSLNYINALKSAGGKASLQTLAAMLRLDEATIKNFIEPILLKRRIISIGSGGRKLVCEVQNGVVSDISGRISRRKYEEIRRKAC